MLPSLAAAILTLISGAVVSGAPSELQPYQTVLDDA